MLYFQMSDRSDYLAKNLPVNAGSRSGRGFGPDDLRSLFSARWRVCRTLSALLMLVLLAAPSARADDSKVLRIITWADYVPADVVAQFKKETGIEVEVTLSNNEEMISKLRATGGAGYDLAQPSQDRITGVQREFGIYKPIDLSKVKLEQFQPELLEIVRKNATLDGKLYGAALSVGHRRAGRQLQARTTIADYPDLCRPDLKGRTAVRLRRPTSWPSRSPRARIRSRSTAIPRPTPRSWSRSATTLIACKANFRSSTTTRTSCSTASAPAKSWAADDVGHRRLDAQPRESRHQFIVPKLRRARLARHLCAAGARPQ